MSNYDKLIANLDRFIRKYYVNMLVRGSLYFLGLVVGVFLLFTLLEYAFYFSTTVRKVLFFSFLTLFALSAYIWILDPIFRYMKLGRQISHEQAAKIIGTHFTEVKDKLLNILQLKTISAQRREDSLVQASIIQKTDEIRLIPFPKAIDLSKNRKYLRFALPPMFILFGLLLVSPSLIRESSKRLIENNTEFARPAPFEFVILNNSLEVIQFEDFELKVQTDGKALPNEVFIQINDFSYRLSKENKSTFHYIFRNVKDDISFSLYSGGVSSKTYSLKTLLKPQISNLELALNYPSYIGKRNERLKNTGDVVIPEGTEVSWKVYTRNVGNASLRFARDNRDNILQQSGNQSFTGKKQVFKSSSYKLYFSNEYVAGQDSVGYNIQVIPDRYPSISVIDYRDSTDNKLVYFQGESEDDYGLTQVVFQYQIRNESDEIIGQERQILRKSGSRQVSFDYLLNIDSFNLKPGDQLTYFFEAFDNDAINGSKSSRTSIMEYRKPTAEEYEQLAEENSDEIKEDLKKILDESKKIQEELKALREKLLSKKELSWEDKKELEQLLDQQKALDKQMNKAREKFNENLQNQQEYSDPSEQLEEKQEKLDEIFEESMDEESKELLDKIQELLQEMQREDALEMMEDFNFDQQEMEMNTERLLELYKQLELEQQLMEQQQKLEELADKQDELSEETEKTVTEDQEKENSNVEEEKEGKKDSDNNDGNDKKGEKENPKSQEELKKEQENIQKEFEKISEKLDELEKKNEELERPKAMEDSEQQEREIKQDMQQSQQQLDKNQNKKASEKQKQAAQKMRQMASQMQNAMMNSQMQQMQEDMKSLRQLLENLVDLSFDQEDLINSFSRTSAYTPKYVDLVQSQYKIKEDFKMVEDSLRALSKRVSQIESFIIDKVYDVNKNIERSLDRLEERQKTQASDNQRRTMTNLNDLALMLSETMQQMQQQMSSMMPGNQMCSKPGSQGQGSGQGATPGDKMSEGQGELNKEIERWKKALKESGKPGPGSKEFAEMAARQAELRKALEDMQKQLREQGSGSEELQQIIENMNKTETELVNKTLTNETLERQKEILTRLLEAERAERERKWDNKREAQTARETEKKLPPEIEKYIKARESEIEFFQTISPDLRPFYRQLVESYYQSLRQ